MTELEPRSETAVPIPGQESEEEVEELVSRKANGASLLVIISRITGFGRTMAQANALSGALMSVASCYTVASNLPNMLYELVMGGMLITSFLPVYLSVRGKLGRTGAAAYASNLLSLVLIVMGVLSVACLIFAAPIVWTQSAGADAAFDFELAVWFFRFFAFEVILYGMSSVISGVLNAERDYWWSTAAPIVNNVITIASFSLYAFLVKGGVVGWLEGLIILAVGNPLGVAAQVFIQLPALRRHGVRLRFRVDLHDPAIKETLTIGLPTLIIMLSSFPTNAVQSSCALQVTANGAAISYYARVWYVLPYSILVIPITTALFTELSNYRVAERMDAYRRTVASGIRKVGFTTIPCMLLLMTFAPYLVAILGGLDAEDAMLTATYLQVQSLALPFYGVSTYLQKVCSSLMRMKIYMVASVVAAVIQVAFCIVLTPIYGLYVVPLSSTFLFFAVDVISLISIRREIGAFGLRSIVAPSLRAFGFGILGSAVGWVVLHVLTFVLGEPSGTLMGILFVAGAGIPAIVASFGVAYMMGVSESPFFDGIFRRISRLLKRA
ncbi:murein biosynthesis integral membrane protein MurJ [uncultured Enorma sp.]|jgi:putative peptidoglycan lipid II flippase|uniref:murein biosynthesis integral membrane protein MurJ n=1 Tax=uncultured Enorma sp. TaxID=1714346 RepID=UPI0025F3783A|nr:murein biosynthesis integral membrane protein MurJ [uncultured Enorma sp.]